MWLFGLASYLFLHELSNLLRGVDSIHLRHGVVHENQVIRRSLLSIKFGDHFDSLDAVQTRLCGQLELLQHCLDRDDVVLVIINQQDTCFYVIAFISTGPSEATCLLVLFTIGLENAVKLCAVRNWVRLYLLLSERLFNRFDVLLDAGDQQQALSI